MMRFLTADVRNGRSILDDPTDLPDGTDLELVSADDVENNGGDLLYAEERAELRQELEASFAEEDGGQLIDVADVIADLKAHREKP